MSTKGKPQRRNRNVQRIQELRRSNAAQPIRNRKRYSRQDRYAGRLVSVRSEW